MLNSYSYFFKHTLKHTFHSSQPPHTLKLTLSMHISDVPSKQFTSGIYPLVSELLGQKLNNIFYHDAYKDHRQLFTDAGIFEKNVRVRYAVDE